MVKTALPVQGMRVQSLVRELKSFMLCNVTRKKNAALHEHGLWHHKTIIIVLSKITVTDHHNKFNSNESFEISPELPK